MEKYTFLSGVIQELASCAPNAVFTKAEAAEKCCQIVEKEVEELDVDESYLEIEFSVEDFDHQSERFDDLLDDVRFIGWDLIDNVITSKKIELEEN